MTIQQTSAILLILKTAYPNFYRNTSKEEAGAALKLWHAMFKQEDYELVEYALYRLIETHSGFPPDIAAVKEKLREVTAAATGEPTDEELWQILVKALSNGYYGAEEEFEKLPSVLKRYLGSPSALRELAVIDIDILRTVTHGQFLKQIGTIRDRQEYEDSLPEPVKEAVKRIFRRPEQDAIASPAAWNDARNLVVNQLDQLQLSKNHGEKRNDT